MKKNSILLLLSLISEGCYANAIPNPQPAQNSENIKKITPEFLYSYVDFKFDSTKDNNFNRYQGSSNIYTVGAEHIVLANKLNAGLYILKVDTSLTSQFSIVPNSVAHSSQSIHNYTLFGHARKTLSERFSVDFSGGYGQNKIASGVWTVQNTPDINFGTANRRSVNWFSGINGIYLQSWKKLSLKANIGALYSQLDSKNYSLFYENTAQTIPHQRNKVTWLTEGAEFGYSLTPEITPFVNAGLIQVVQFSNIPSDLPVPVNGLLPQLNMNKNGFKVGGGLVYNKKQFTLRLEERYYNSAGTFNSFQTTAALEYRFL